MKGANRIPIMYCISHSLSNDVSTLKYNKSGGAANIDFDIRRDPRIREYRGQIFATAKIVKIAVAKIAVAIFANSREKREYLKFFAIF